MAKKFFKEFALLNFPENQLLIKYNYIEPSGNSSNYKGVSYNLKLNNWRSSLSINKKRYYSDYLQSEENAAYAYDFLCLQHFGPTYTKFNMNGSF